MSDTPALFSKGFRPFFVLAAGFAAGFLPLWLLTYTGHFDAGAYWAPAVWHGHEMVFGFAVAVVAGFLLTAVSNWTRRPTAEGGWLAALCAVWVAGRAAMIWSGELPAWLVAGADLAFLPALAVAIGRPMVQARNRRNFKFLGVLALLWSADWAMHLSAMGAIADVSRTALLFALDMIVVITLVIGGRIIPAFTRNATGGGQIHSNKFIERLVFGAALATIVLRIIWPVAWATGAVGAVAGLAIIARQWRWGVQQTWDKPILWVLHVGHAWLAVGFLLRAVAVFVPRVPDSLGTHALTVGAIGMLTLGMMARVALGHTGRPLHVARPIAWAFAAMGLAALTRTILPIVWPSHYLALIVASGSLFALAFVVYLVHYVPILVRPRADARRG